MKSRTRVMLLFGGRSSEHTISCATAHSVYGALDQERYEVVPVGISPRGEWALVDFTRVDYSLRSDVEETGAQVDPHAPGCRPLYVRLGAREFLAPQTAAAPASPSAPTCPSGESPVAAAETETAPVAPLALADLGPIDVVFPLLHGSYGEDGTVQGLLELLDLPYVGCGVLASAACMEKGVTKKLLAAEGLPVGEYVTFTARDWARPEKRQELSAWVESVGERVFVKPCRAGSSLGVHKVDRLEDFAGAVEEALKLDPHVIVEKLNPGWEVECGVLEYPGPTGETRASLLGAIGFKDTGADFYDYETKYYAGGQVEVQIPAPLPAALTEKVRDLALRAFAAVQGEGVARVDFFVEPESGQVVINEINTLPGCTPYSMYPQLWKASGVEYSELLSILLEQALARPSGLR